MTSRGDILFFDVGNRDHLPLVEAVAESGFRPILNATPLRAAALQSGLFVAPWEAYCPPETFVHVQKQVDALSARFADALGTHAVRESLARTIARISEDARRDFFEALFSLLANQVAALDIFDALYRQSALRLLVLGYDNNHVQRVLIEAARARGVPSLQLAHGIYAPVRARVAGEADTVYADRAAVYGDRSMRILADLGNAPERLVVTGAPTWDPLYRASARIDPQSARIRLGLDPDRPTILFCGGYADGSFGFFSSVLRDLARMREAVLGAIHAFDRDAQLLLRPHPHELGRAGVPEALQLDLFADFERCLARDRLGRAPRRLRVTTRDKLACLRAADVVVVTGHSTMAVEAMILERPVVLLPFSHQAPPVYDDGDGLVVVDDLRELPRVFQKLRPRAARRTVIERQNAALPALNHGNDGRATGRVAALIEELVATERRGSSPNPFDEEPFASRPSSPRPSKHLNILMTAHDFLPHSRAGTELYTYELSRALERAGHDVRVLHPRFVTHGDTTPTLTETDYQGLAVVEMFTGAEAASTLRNDAVLPELRRYLVERRPDLVHAQHLLGLSVSFLELLRELRIPIVLTANDYWWLCEQIHLVQPGGAICNGPETAGKCVRCLEKRMGRVPFGDSIDLKPYIDERLRIHRAALSSVDLVICPSLYLLDRFRAHGFEGRRMVHLPQGVARFDVVDQVVRSDPGRVRVIFFGSIGHRKGLDLLLSAFGRIGEAGAELHVHGEVVEGEYFERCQRLAAENPAITFHGAYAPPDLPHLLAGADLCVFPSRGENSPFVIREALQARVPVIAAAVGGVPEIVRDGVNGLLFRNGDEIDLATKLLYAIENRNERVRWRESIVAVKSIAEEARELERLYEETLRERARESEPTVTRQPDVSVSIDPTTAVH